jgi:hypothetical protein
MAAETHDYLWDTPVREIEGKEIPGFLLAASGPVMAPVFWAHYVDGVIEAIDPPAGFPRPDPDPAVRSKRVAIPTSLRTRPNVLQKQGSRYSGQMRRIVQCLNSRGLESRFKYTWPKTHGILEYPYPRQVGSTAGDEAVNFAKRRFWIIEISSAGVYAAPIGMGLQCMTCATQLSDYAQPGEDVDLAWAFVNKNEGGKVLQVMTAAAIAPAYANGSPWYLGMGWAFSWSGRSASNVVQRLLTLPDRYATRVIDLEFSVAFEEAAIDYITAVAGVATVGMPGHGFNNGDLVVISGATPDGYNGAHIIREADAGAFKFSVANGISSPAGGTPKAANALSTATITAALTIGSAGSVIFRKNDLGTMWVPGDEQPTRWVGVRPIDAIRNMSGPVHVFYDGEEKIVTTWSMQTTQIPLDQRLDQHPPDIAFTGNSNPLSQALRDYYEVALWNGVTGSFHFWGGDYQYTEPVAQSFQSGYPDHPCAKRYRPTVIGSGHSYSGYTSLSWGFTGPFNMSVEAYSRRRLTSVTSYASDHYRIPYADYSYGDRYYVCSGGSWDTAHLCIALFKSEAYQRDLTKALDTRDESMGGGSALILLPLDREAVAGLKRTRSSFSNSQRVHRGNFRSKIREGGHPVAVPDHPACAFTNWEMEWNGYPADAPPATDTVTATSGASNSMSFSLRASGGISYSGSFVDGSTPDLDPFAIYQYNVKETADSSLFFMRGGLEYPDPGLTPANQIANNVKHVVTYSLSGGFAALPAGRDPVAFIGQV